MQVSLEDASVSTSSLLNPRLLSFPKIETFFDELFERVEPRLVLFSNQSFPYEIIERIIYGREGKLLMKSGFLLFLTRT